MLTSEEFTAQRRIPTKEELHSDSCSNGESPKGYGSLLERANLPRLGGNRTVSSRLRRDLREMLKLRTEGIGLGQEYRVRRIFNTLAGAECEEWSLRSLVNFIRKLDQPSNLKTFKDFLLLAE